MSTTQRGALLHLTHNPAKLTIAARLAQIDELISAEFSRDRESFAAQCAGLSHEGARARLIAQYPPIVGYGNETHSYPYTPLVMALEDERRALVQQDRAIGESCGECGQEHPQLWTVRRVLIDTFGQFPVFRLNGAEIVPDTRLPIETHKIPRGAVKLSPAQAARYWHSN